MQREIQLTADGSHTLSIPEMKVTYHSHHGAIGESVHVYIDAGLQPILNHPPKTPIHIFEMGFGTGLNTLLSLQKALACKQPVKYTAVELYPLTDREIAHINYGHLMNAQEDFLAIHNCEWEKEIHLSEFFILKKLKAELATVFITEPVHCIYFDAFSPTVQPELWTREIFEKMYKALAPGGILVTYCSKSEIRRNMTAAGFTVTKIPGPWGKREMVRAQKLSD